jgi:hypothetical protein|tara:strand:+ start:3776 stop:4093 length:318 start_codon:yes stop_codon:yes gene_type:complete
MAHWTLVTYTRPQVLTDWYSPTAEVVSKIDEWKNTDPKKIEHYEVKESDDGLKQFYKIGFKDTDTSLAFLDESAAQSNETARNAHCESTGITAVVNQYGENEPIL